jgi:hypothetical protein
VMRVGRSREGGGGVSAALAMSGVGGGGVTSRQPVVVCTVLRTVFCFLLTDVYLYNGRETAASQ